MLVNKPLSPPIMTYWKLEKSRFWSEINAAMIYLSAETATDSSISSNKELHFWSPVAYLKTSRLLNSSQIDQSLIDVVGSWVYQALKQEVSGFSAMSPHPWPYRWYCSRSDLMECRNHSFDLEIPKGDSSVGKWLRPNEERGLPNT